MFGRIRDRLVARWLDRQGRSDIAKLAADRPELVPDEGAWEDALQSLLPAHSAYTTDISTTVDAASLETCAYLSFLCTAVRPHRVTDLGSGFSSYVLRSYARSAADPVHVVSVDDSPEWLRQTSAFLSTHGLSLAGLTGWEAYRAEPGEPSDLVFHDFARGSAREEAMAVAVAGLASGGVIVFDDAQHDGHRARMETECAAAGLRLYSLRQRTLDVHGRWAMLGVS